MPSESSKGRMFALKRIFEEETDAEVGLTMPQLIERLAEDGFEVERKAVYRDLKVLRDFGYDIQKYQRHPVEYGLASRVFSENDLMALVDAVQSSRFMTERQSNGLVTKLKGMASRRQRKVLKKQVHVSGRVKMKNESVFNNVDAIQKAMAEKHKVSFRYFAYGCDLKPQEKNEGNRYVATPVAVLYVNGYYYLVAYSETFDTPDHMKNFRADRMTAIMIDSASADRNETISTFNSAEYEQGHLDMFAGKVTSVVLHVQQSAMNAVIDRFGQDLKVSKVKKDSANVHVSVATTPVFWGWVAQFDGAVTVESPKRTRAEFADYLEGLASRHRA